MKDLGKAAIILGFFAISEGTWVVVNASADTARFLHVLGFAPGQMGTPIGWLAATLITVLFVYRSARLPSVRANLLKPSLLKGLAILMAVAAGILEEAVFRRMLMNYTQQQGYGVLAQVLVSAAAFGISHGVWGLFGRSLPAAVGATIATGLLGGALAIVYVLSARSVAACIASHVVIDMLIEPGLVLAALRGEMQGRQMPQPDLRSIG
jgi:membrane protease YdiL (CAAX protease family)